MNKSIRILAFVAVFCALPLAASAKFYSYLEPRPVQYPAVYLNSANNIQFYVESDGRHIAAIDPNGKLLWVRDPFKDAKLSPYRLREPRIDMLGPLPENSGADRTHFLALKFDSSQFGLLNMQTGEFQFMGQD